MPNLQDYYRDLLTWEGVPTRQLVDSSPPEFRSIIESELVTAVAAASLTGSVCPIKAGTTNQSIGNKVEKFTVDALAPHLVMFCLGPCSGSGYPDKMGSSTPLHDEIQDQIPGRAFSRLV